MRDHNKYITIPDFNELTAGSFATRLKQADWVNKTN